MRGGPRAWPTEATVGKNGLCQRWTGLAKERGAQRQAQGRLGAQGPHMSYRNRPWPSFQEASTSPGSQRWETLRPSKAYEKEAPGPVLGVLPGGTCWPPAGSHVLSVPVPSEPSSPAPALTQETQSLSALGPPRTWHSHLPGQLVTGSSSKPTYVPAGRFGGPPAGIKAPGLGQVLG